MSASQSSLLVPSYHSRGLAHGSAIFDRATLAASVFDYVQKAAVPEAMRFAAIVENVIAMIQASVAPTEYAEVGENWTANFCRSLDEANIVSVLVTEFRPGVADMGRRFRPWHLGTDAAGRGAGWDKTQNTVNVVQAFHDAMNELNLNPGTVSRSMRDILVAAVMQGKPQSEWGGVANAVCGSIIKRMTTR